MLEGREEGRIIHIIFFIFFKEGKTGSLPQKRKKGGFIVELPEGAGNTFFFLFILLDGVST